MTLALILAIVFGVVWINHNANLKIEKQKERQRTITNITLQDELFCKNFIKIMNDLREIDNQNTLMEDAILTAIESLYKKYDIPNKNNDAQRNKDMERFKKDIEFIRWNDRIAAPLHELTHEKYQYRYPEDSSTISLYKRIFYDSLNYEEKALSTPQLLFGEKGEIKIINDKKYIYDDISGILKYSFYSVPASYIFALVQDLTRRDIYNAGFNYSSRREKPLWQQYEEGGKESYEENKKKYPWLYRRD